MMPKANARNVLGGPLQPCSMDPLTGFFRDGCCNTSEDDRGSHTLCVQVTEQFLSYTKAMGNDLITPNPRFLFPGLKAGDRWCVCAMRWKEAMDDGVAPPVVLESCHESALRFVTLDQLQRYALPNPATAKQDLNA